MEPQQNEVILFEHLNFEEKGRIRHLMIHAYAAGIYHSLHELDFKDCLSSLKWKLDPGIVVTFKEDEGGRSREYPISGENSDPNTHDNNFKDCASAFKWSRA